MRLERVIWWATEKEKQERRDRYGLLVNEGDGPLLDNKGKAAVEVWDYHRTQDFIVTVDMGDSQ